MKISERKRGRERIRFFSNPVACLREMKEKTKSVEDQEQQEE